MTNVEQIGLFDVNEDEKNWVEETYHKFIKVSYVEKVFMSVKDAFSDFTVLYAVTYSFDLKFINKIASMFEHVKLVLGAPYLVEKSEEMHDLIVNWLSNEAYVGKEIGKYPVLREMLESGDLEIRVPKYMMDHRKLYILNDDNHRTRVIKPSANFTKAGFDASHMEQYDFFDNDEKAYKEHLDDFDTLWNDSEPIAKEASVAKNCDNPVDVVDKVNEDKNRSVVFIPQETEDVNLIRRYIIETEPIKNCLKETIKGIKIDKEQKSGKVAFDLKNLKVMKSNKIKIDQQRAVINKTTEELHPKLTVNYDTEEMFLNGEKLDLNPKKEEIQKGVSDFISLFEFYKDNFIGDIPTLKYNHFKLINYIWNILRRQILPSFYY